MDDPVVVLVGFGPHGQMLASLLETPLSSLPDSRGKAYVAFDLDPARVQVSSIGLDAEPMQSMDKNLGIACTTYRHTGGKLLALKATHALPCPALP
jgi:hypothetical protein